MPASIMNPGDMGTWLLAIDTSTGMAGVAAFSGDRIVSRNWASDRTQTQTLAARVEEVIAELGVAIGDLAALAVSTGPGSFTGLRVGMAYAKGLALIDDLPIVGIPTLELIAWPIAQHGEAGLAVIPAGRGRVVWSEFAADGEIERAINSSFDEFRAICAHQSHLSVHGELLDEQWLTLEAEGISVAASPTESRVEVLARLGWERWRSDEADDLATLVPQYLHGNPNPRQGRDGGVSGPRG